MVTGTEERGPWELETGLPNDVDAWMTNCRFGTKEEYAQAVVATGGEVEGVAGLMFITDLVDENGVLIGSQGWSVGSGWIPSDDGKSMRHPTRRNVVDTSRYGQLQRRVMKDLGVDMSKFGVPTVAPSWDGLGFHWMLEEHPTITGQASKRGLMPVQSLGKKDIMVAAQKAPKVAGDVEKQLADLVDVSPNSKVFQKAALKLEAVTKNDDIMADVLDDSPTGFYIRHKKS